ncbi:hypothetical protein CEXT_42371 [Caerostris extrusa]|uniref:Uncharacterized protein n=1 Tax=Caerostris extrusa TaxID=172846 RepID=A0AAV4W852_CAEEX|nr:hypothetical protein CEXT_42371 [Caerostris extrusa]
MNGCTSLTSVVSDLALRAPRGTWGGACSRQPAPPSTRPAWGRASSRLSVPWERSAASSLHTALLCYTQKLAGLRSPRLYTRAILARTPATRTAIWWLKAQMKWVYWKEMIQSSVGRNAIKICKLIQLPALFFY